MTFHINYIRNRRTDIVCFLALPFLALLIALASQAWLPYVALASFNLWITVPHHFGTWSRTFGLSEDWQRFRSRVILGPLLILAMTLLGVKYAPLTLFLVVFLWDHQHSVMQQHGFARIYDFKAGTGTAATGKLDLFLGLVLFGNMLLTAPLWTEIWVQQLFIWNYPIDELTVRQIQRVSWVGTLGYVGVYAVYVLHSMAAGHSLNPMKYLFLFASYFLWYYASWHTNSVLVFGIAHRLMHGVQYLLIVYWYLQRKNLATQKTPWFLPKLHFSYFALMGLAYAVFFQLLLLRPLDEFGFGLASFVLQTDLSAGMEAPSLPAKAYDLYATTIISSTALTHYYFDSFIWKVRDEKTQEGLQ